MEEIDTLVFGSVVLVISLVIVIITYCFKDIGLQKAPLEEDEIPASDGDSSANRASTNSNRSIEQKLDKLYDVMNHLRWIGLGIGGMFAMTFIIPQFCTGV